MQISKITFAFLMKIVFLLILRLNAFGEGNITYTLHYEKKPTNDRIESYRRIKIAMDSALVHYNRLTTITKNLNVYYNTGVKTADANFNGTIRFGPNRFFMVVHTAMHEIAHSVGVGTTTQYKNLVKNRIFTGSRATAVLREITGDSDAVLHGDSQHFWPFGLNYAKEVKSEQDLINHCRIVNAMYKDMFEREVFLKKNSGSRSTEKIEINLVDGWLRIRTIVPLTERVNINININIVDTQGRLICQKEFSGNTSVVFNTALFTRGVYVANVYSGNRTTNRTFFVK